MSRKLAHGAFCANNGIFEFAARRIATATATATLTQRTFSSTARQNKEMVYFSKASTPELEAVLAEIRHKIILPGYLPKVQRKKIHAKKYEKALQSDPITIEIDSEVFKFRYQSPFVGIPNSVKSLFRALALFDTPQDFNNLRPLIQGLNVANRKLKVDKIAKLTRIVGEKGQIYRVIELARSVKHTGFKLDHSEKVTEILHHVQMKAVESDWDPEQTAQALRWAEMVVEMLEEEDHQPSSSAIPDESLQGMLPLHRDPMVLLSPLHLAAALALKQDAEVDPDLVSKIAKYATKLVVLWDEGKALRQTQPEALFAPKGTLEYIAEPNKFVKLAAPWLYGLDTAIKVLQSYPQHEELVTKLQTRRDILAAEVQKDKENSLYKGQDAWQKVFERKAAEESEQEAEVEEESK
ncbi:hypothetical protein F5B19DRAFT_488358 [Rostrohypoxylon terebratum]|nr:hypothetical protein F5B19DRAFT_488358 [Rostrohypoxylon terebratum]